MLNVEFGSLAKRFLKNCNKDLQERILAKIEKLRENPFPQEVKRVEGKKDKIFRVRVGKYRILYAVFLEQNALLIADIDDRESVY